jgi:hypothetical protein
LAFNFWALTSQLHLPVPFVSPNKQEFIQNTSLTISGNKILYYAKRIKRLKIRSKIKCRGAAQAHSQALCSTNWPRTAWPATMHHITHPISSKCQAVLATGTYNRAALEPSINLNWESLHPTIIGFFCFCFVFLHIQPARVATKD